MAQLYQSDYTLPVHRAINRLIDFDGGKLFEANSLQGFHTGCKTPLEAGQPAPGAVRAAELGLKHLQLNRWIKNPERVVLFNEGMMVRAPNAVRGGAST
jgi:hypothetical protein